MSYLTDDLASTHMPWLHGRGRRRHSFADIHDTLTSEMRRVNTTPGATPKSPMDEMRIELLKIWSAMGAFGHRSTTLRGQVFSTLDIRSIEQLLAPSDINIDRTTWNQIAPHLTPEIIDAYCSKGNDSLRLSFFYKGAIYPSEEVILRIIAGWRDMSPNFLHGFFMATREGKLSATIGLAAMRRHLDKVPHVPEEIVHIKDHMRDLCLRDTVWRLIAVLEPDLNWFGDTWRTTHDDLNRVLDLTHSRHGHLKLRAHIPDLEELVRDPEAVIARLTA